MTGHWTRWFLIAALIGAVQPYVWGWFGPFGSNLATLVMYSGWDIEYLPIAPRFVAGEGVVLEHLGAGLRPFPFVSLVAHNLLIPLTGDVGYVLVDLLCTGVVFWLLLKVFRVTRCDERLGLCASLLIATHASEAAQWGLSQVSGSAELLRVSLWGVRLPRPFVTEVFFLLCLFLLLTLADGRRRPRHWALLGASLGLLTQGDFYSAFVFSFVILGLLLHRTWRARCRGGRWAGVAREVLTETGGAVVTLAISLGPFFVQFFQLAPETAARLGFFEWNRWSVLWQPYAIPQAVITTALLGVVRYLDRARTDGRKAQLTLLMAMVGVAYIAPALLGWTLGRSTQVFHFQEVFYHASSYALVLLVLWKTGDALHRGARRWRSRSAFTGVAATLIVLALGLSAARGYTKATNGRAAKIGFPYFDQWGHNYRGPFQQLTRELASPNYASARVIGTLDPQVFSWWTTFRRGSAFIPDAFLSPLPDHVLEDRLLKFCAFLEMSRARFETLTDSWYVLAFWLGHDKYQASSAFTFSALQEYTEPERASIAGTTIYDSWNLILPYDETLRLQGQLEREAIRSDTWPELDVVVLTNGDQRDLKPPETWRPAVFTNDVFRVYVRPR